MSNNEKIGLVVWGCKGGHRVFCSKGVDVKQKEINDTIKDIRSYWRFIPANLTTYAVEFTEQYKVFTLYRSCNDTGTGGYVAITVYVPHELRVINLRASLDAAMDNYFKEFVHPVFGTYLDGTYDSIDQYESFLDGLEVEEDRLYDYKVSKQDDRPLFVLYDSVEGLDKYFDNPYRKEFYDCQEVMFMSRELYNRGRDAYEFNDNINNNIEEYLIEHVSEPEKLPSLDVGDADGIKLLEINGKKKEVPGSYEVVKGKDKDEVRIVLTKQHCEDYEAKGTVSSLMRQGILIERDKKIKVCLSKINFKYKTYQISFTLDGKPLPNDLVYIKSKNGQINVKGGKLSISGEEVTNSYEMYFRPSSTISDCSIYLCKFLPKDYISENTIKNLDLGQRNDGLQKEEIKVEVDSGVKSDAKIRVYVSNDRNEFVPIPISSISRAGKLELYIKKDKKLSSSSFESSDKEVEVKFEDNRLTVRSLCLEFEMEIPSEVKNLVGHWDFTICGNSKKNEGYPRSWKVKIEPTDKIKEGKLAINGLEYEYEIKGNKIIPRMALIKIKGGCECEATWLTQDKEAKFDSNTILPYKREDKDKLELKLSDESYTTSESRTLSPIVTIEVRKKSSENDDKRKISAEFCDLEGFTIISESRQTSLINKNIYEINQLRGSVYTIRNNKTGTEFSLYKYERDYPEEERRDNERNGFFIEYNGNRIIVTRKGDASSKSKEKIKGGAGSTLKKKIKIGLYALAGIVFLGVIALFVPPLFDSGEVQGLTVKFEIQGNTYGEKIERVHFKDYASGNDYIELDKDSLAIYVDKDFSAKYSELENMIKQPLIFEFDSGEKVDTVLYKWDQFREEIESYKKAEKEQVSKTTLTLKITAPLTKKKKEVEKCVSEIGTEIEKLLQYYDSLIQQVDNEQFKSEINARKNDVTEEINKQEELKKIVKEANSYKNILWKLDCNKTTVQNVSRWWDRLDESQKNTVKSEISYDFGTAIDLYGKFFNANNIDDIKEICEMKKANNKSWYINKCYFSKEQWTVIVSGYGVGMEGFKTLKKQFRMSFSEPYNRYFKNN